MDGIWPSAQDDVKVMEWLLRNMAQHADVNHCTGVSNEASCSTRILYHLSRKGYTPLLLACKYQNIDTLKLLQYHEHISEAVTTTSVSPNNGGMIYTGW